MAEYIVCDALDDFKSEVVDTFINMCGGNDYDELALFQICDAIECIYDKHIEKHIAADVVEVVRCKDCKHYNKKYAKCLLHSEDADQYSSGFIFEMYSRDFCSYGEAKMDGKGEGDV